MSPVRQVVRHLGLRGFVTLLLLTGLLFMRLPFLVWMRMSYSPTAWASGTHTFMNVTYVLNALLIVWERKRLEMSNFDGYSLALYILSPLIGWPVLLAFAKALPGSVPSYATIPLVQVIVATAVGVFLLLTRTRLCWQRKTLQWIGVGVFAGLLMSLMLGIGTAFSQEVPDSRPWSMIVASVTVSLVPTLTSHLVQAASLEEPLFRGFLWGHLRMWGWSERTAWLFASALFIAGHLYYLGRMWFDLLVIVPVGALVFGLLAWRSRSLAPSMLAHAIANTLIVAINGMAQHLL